MSFEIILACELCFAKRIRALEFFLFCVCRLVALQMCSQTEGLFATVMGASIWTFMLLFDMLTTIY
jgi:hypothetical protein